MGRHRAFFYGLGVAVLPTVSEVVVGVNVGSAVALTTVASSVGVGLGKGTLQSLIACLPALVADKSVLYLIISAAGISRRPASLN